MSDKIIRGMKTIYWFPFWGIIRIVADDLRKPVGAPESVIPDWCFLWHSLYLCVVFVNIIG